MTFYKLGCLSLIAFFLQSLSAQAQSSLDALERDLNQMRQEHQESSSQDFTNFLNQLDSAMQSPDAAINLYQKAGGNMPDAAAVQTEHEHETPSEKAAREARDVDKISNLAYVAQVHCGLMRYAACLIVNPNEKGLHDNWIAWLKTTARIYPQLKEAGDLTSIPVSHSLISRYLSFSQWGDKEQGQWRIKDLPKIYQTEILEQLRTAHNPDELEAWDVYIAMMGADEQYDLDKWTQIDFPYLQFQRGCDDFTLSPSTDKLETLVDIIKANPKHPKAEDMMTQVAQMVQDYRKQKANGVTSTVNKPLGVANP